MPATRTHLRSTRIHDEVRRTHCAPNNHPCSHAAHKKPERLLFLRRGRDYSANHIRSSSRLNRQSDVGTRFDLDKYRNLEPDLRSSRSTQQASMTLPLLTDDQMIVTQRCPCVDHYHSRKCFDRLLLTMGGSAAADTAILMRIAFIDVPGAILSAVMFHVRLMGVTMKAPVKPILRVRLWSHTKGKSV